MNTRHTIYLLTLVLSLWIVASCTPVPTEPALPAATATPPPGKTSPPSPGLANPAAVYCEEQGHTLEIRTDKNGNQYGVCVFGDGTECEEWAYFRGECSPGAPAATLVATATPTPEPPPEPAADCTPITVESGPEYRLWREYTHEKYGFTLLVPPSWVVEEIVEPPQHTLRDHAVILWSAEEPTARFRVAFRRLDEERFIGRTGVGSGDIVEAGTVCFVGQEMGKRALVFEGKDMTVLYGPGAEVERGDMAFTLYLDYRGGWEDESALSKEIQAQVDQIIASVQLPSGS
jgi:putative hemolysin